MQQFLLLRPRGALGLLLIVGEVVRVFKLDQIWAEVLALLLFPGFSGGLGVGVEFLVGPAGFFDGFDGIYPGMVLGVMLRLPGLQVPKRKMILLVVLMLIPPIVLVTLLRFLANPADLVGMLILHILAVVLERSLFLVAVAAHFQHILRGLLDVLSDELQLLDFLFIFALGLIAALMRLHHVNRNEEVAAVVLVVEGGRGSVFPRGEAAGALGCHSLAFYLLSALHRSIILSLRIITSARPPLPHPTTTD